MAITAEQVKELRERTGIGMMECKKALEEADCHMDKAIEILRKKGYARAKDKAERMAGEGLIGSYIHIGSATWMLTGMPSSPHFSSNGSIRGSSICTPQAAGVV